MDDLELARQRRNAIRRAQYAADGGKRRAENQVWKDAHREEVRAASREYQRVLRKSRPEHAKALQKASYVRNREKRIASTKAWHVANPGYNSKKQAEYREKDPVKFMLRNYKNRAADIGVMFSLTRDSIVIPDICPVLGIPIYKGEKHGRDNSPSVDRFDTKKGYTPDNIRVVSWRANRLKSDGTLDEFRKIVAYMENS